MGLHQTKVGLESLDNIKWEGKNILDVGCGNGKLSFKVLEKTKCNKLVGVDIDKKEIKKARKIKTNKMEFITSNVSDLPFDNESFDAIFCNIAFQQFKNKEKALKEMFRVVKKNGEVILNYIEEKSDVLRRLEKIISKPPFNEFVKIKNKGTIKMSKKEFDKLVGIVGFSKIDSTSKNDLIYYKTLYSLLRGYRDTIEGKIKALPEKLKKKSKKELKKELATTKTEKGFPEKWKILFAKMIK